MWINPDLYDDDDVLTNSFMAERGVRVCVCVCVCGSTADKGDCFLSPYFYTCQYHSHIKNRCAQHTLTHLSLFHTWKVKLLQIQMAKCTVFNRLCVPVGAACASRGMHGRMCIMLRNSSCWGIVLACPGASDGSVWFREWKEGKLSWTAGLRSGWEEPVAFRDYGFSPQLRTFLLYTARLWLSHLNGSP